MATLAETSSIDSEMTQDGARRGRGVVEFAWLDTDDKSPVWLLGPQYGSGYGGRTPAYLWVGAVSWSLP